MTRAEELAERWRDEADAYLVRAKKAEAEAEALAEALETALPYLKGLNYDGSFAVEKKATDALARYRGEK